jgi:hypothetical protein
MHAFLHYCNHSASCNGFFKVSGKQQAASGKQFAKFCEQCMMDHILDPNIAPGAWTCNE